MYQYLTTRTSETARMANGINRRCIVDWLFITLVLLDKLGEIQRFGEKENKEKKKIKNGSHRTKGQKEEQPIPLIH